MERDGGKGWQIAEDERKSSAPDQSTTRYFLEKRERSLHGFFSLSLSLEIILLFSRLPFAWKKIQREGERLSLPRDGWKIKCTALLRESDCKQDLSFCFSLVWKSKFVWEGGSHLERARQSGIGSFALFSDGKFVFLTGRMLDR